MLIRKFLSLTGYRLLSLVLMVIFLGLIPFVIPADEFGSYNLILSVVLVISSGLLSFGNHALLRFGREELKHQDQIGRSLATRLVLHVLMFVVGMFLLFAVWPLLQPTLGIQEEYIFVVIGIAVIIVSFNEMGTAAAQTTERFTGFGIAPVALRIIQLAALAVIFLTKSSSWQILLWGTLCGYLLSAGITWSRIPRKTVGTFSFDANRFKGMLTYSWSLPFAAVSVISIDWMDIWFIQHYLGLSETGTYAWVYSMVLVIRTIVAPLSALMVPGYIDMRITDDRSSWNAILNASQTVLHIVLALCLLPVGVSLAVISGANLGSYQNVLVLAAVLVPAAVFQMGITFWYPMICADKTLIGKGSAVLVLSALGNAMGNILFIPYLGVVGAAWSTALATWLAAMGFLWILRADSGDKEKGTLIVRRIWSIAISGLLVALTSIISVHLSAGQALMMCLAVTLGLLFWLWVRGEISSLAATVKAYRTGRSETSDLP